MKYILLALTFLLFSRCDSSNPDALEGNIVVFAFEGRTEQMRVQIDHAPTLEAARDYIAGRSTANIPIGPIVRGAGVDPDYPFHFIPTEVRLAELALELCDGAPMHTPAEVDAFIAGSTGDPDAESATWCPWGARPVAIE